MNIKKPINKRIIDKPIFNSQEMNKAYVDYFKANNIDFEFNGGIAMITKDIVKEDDADYLSDLERAYQNMKW